MQGAASIVRVKMTICFTADSQRYTDAGGVPTDIREPDP